MDRRSLRPAALLLGACALAAAPLPGPDPARADGTEDSAALAGGAMESPTGPVPLPERSPASLPSPEFFGARLEPLLKEACASCHRVGRGGALDLQFGAVTGGPEARTLKNFRAVLAFVDRETPARSALLRKGLSPDAGGLPHAGEPYMQPGTDLDRALRDFLCGATPSNLPPRTDVRGSGTVAAGGTLELDAAGTTDPEGDPVAVRWEVLERPEGSSAAPVDPAGARTRFIPDARGRYRLRLRAGDGKIEALPREILLEIGPAGGTVEGLDGAPSAASPPGGMEPAEAGPMAGPGAAGGMDGSEGMVPPMMGAGSAGGEASADGGLPSRAVGAGEGPPLDVPLDRRRYARGVFFDLRGRGPSPAELAGALRFEPEALVDRMLADPATWESWMEREFYFYLLIDRFRPVSDRVRSLPGRLASGTATVKDATREIVVSAEFNTRNPGNDTFVTVVFEQLLGIVVQDNPRLLEAGKKMYDGYPARIFRELGRSQSDIVRIVLERPGFARTFLERQHLRVFGAPAPDGSLAESAERLASDPAAFPGILREWLLSRTYRARTAIPRPKDDQTWIRTLFVDLLGREPTFAEFRNMRNALLALSDPAPVRNVVAQLMLDSGRTGIPAKETIPRSREWVRGKFLDLLGREATEGELDVFVSTLGEYGCRTETIVLALVTSPDYQYY